MPLGRRHLKKIAGNTWGKKGAKIGGRKQKC